MRSQLRMPEEHENSVRFREAGPIYKRNVMLKIDCDTCGEELKQPGALLFTPPEGDPRCECIKLHLCVKCFDKTLKFLYKIVDNTRRKHAKRKTSVRKSTRKTRKRN